MQCKVESEKFKVPSHTSGLHPLPDFHTGQALIPSRRGREVEGNGPCGQVASGGYRVRNDGFGDNSLNEITMVVEEKTLAEKGSLLFAKPSRYIITLTTSLLGQRRFYY